MPRTALALGGNRGSGLARRGPSGPVAGPLVMVRPTADVLPLVDEVGLAPYERARAVRLPAGPRRDDFLAAHVLARLCAARVTGAPPDSLTLAQTCGDCGGEDHGRPYLPGRPGIGVSLSHTAGFVAAAAGPGPVGVDVEDTSAAVFDPRVAARTLAPAELAAVHADPDPARAFLRLWVRKEALVKVGVTTLGRLRDLDLTDPQAAPGWRFLDLSGADGRLVAAAVSRAAPAHSGDAARADSGDEDLSTSRFPYSGEQHP